MPGGTGFGAKGITSSKALPYFLEWTTHGNKECTLALLQAISARGELMKELYEVPRYTYSSFYHWWCFSLGRSNPFN
jgi:hypothetical protein